MTISKKIKKIYRDAGATADEVTLSIAADLDNIIIMINQLQDTVNRDGMFTIYTSDRGTKNEAQTEAFKALATWQRIKTDKSRLLESIIRRDLKDEGESEWD